MKDSEFIEKVRQIAYRPRVSMEESLARAKAEGREPVFRIVSPADKLKELLEQYDREKLIPLEQK
jgi:hypothetical protein